MARLVGDRAASRAVLERSGSGTLQVVEDAGLPRERAESLPDDVRDDVGMGDHDDVR
jgi:hypothetical protein